MKNLLRLEEFGMAAAGIFLLSRYNLGLSFWIWLALFFTPDIGMLGYLVNTKVGALMYNLFHHKGLALLLAAIGFYLQTNVLIAIGLLLFAHASFDRIFGYGLKYEDDFKHTHLGMIGKG